MFLSTWILRKREREKKKNFDVWRRIRYLLLLCLEIDKKCKFSDINQKEKLRKVERNNGMKEGSRSLTF